MRNQGAFQRDLDRDRIGLARRRAVASSAAATGENCSGTTDRLLLERINFQVKLLFIFQPFFIQISINLHQICYKSYCYRSRDCLNQTVSN